MQAIGPKKIVIVGGGTAGWMTAAALAHFKNALGCEIELIESEHIGTVGVGEATLPHLRFFNETLGINEQEFMQKTQATYKLGIEFGNWGQLNHTYIHPFGDYGFKINNVGFHHYWLKQRQAGDPTPIDAYSVPVIAAQQEKFCYPSAEPQSLLATYSYAFHIDAGLYAKFLRNYAEAKAVKRTEGKIIQVTQSKDNEDITSVTLENGETISGDFFIDCSGFRALLIQETLNTGFESWEHWLPCNRAHAVASNMHSAPLPYTKATADSAGWRWKIPLQNRTGNGHVYCNHFLNDELALDKLLKNLDGAPQSLPITLKFTAGKRKKAWDKNCVAIGLSGGFLEPLESTSIYLIQIAIMKLVEYFPATNRDVSAAEFNRLIDMEYLRIRDFLILHYHATQRTDSAFWSYCRTMSIPDSLAHKMELFRERGHIVNYKGGLFLEPSWLAVYLGQGIIPKEYDPRINTTPQDYIAQQLSMLKQGIEKSVSKMPSHKTFLTQSFNTPLNIPSAQLNLYSTSTRP